MYDCVHYMYSLKVYNQNQEIPFYTKNEKKHKIIQTAQQTNVTLQDK